MRKRDNFVENTLYNDEEIIYHIDSRLSAYPSAYGSIGARSNSFAARSANHRVY